MWNFISTLGMVLRQRWLKTVNSPALRTYAKELQELVEASAPSPDLALLYSNQCLILEYGCWLLQHKHGFLKLKRKATLVQFITSVTKASRNTLLLFMAMGCQPPPKPLLEEHPLSVAWNSLFNIFVATLHIWRPSSPSKTAGHNVL
jgi:hypothetical protein